MLTWFSCHVPACSVVVLLSLPFAFYPLGTVVVSVFAGDGHRCNILPSAKYLRQWHPSTSIGLSHLRSGIWTLTGCFVFLDCFSPVFPLSKIATLISGFWTFCSGACTRNLDCQAFICVHCFSSRCLLYAQLKGTFDFEPHLCVCI